MKFASFSISKGRVMVSMPNDEDIEELLKGLREKFGIEVEVEVRSLCG
ncbi:MAG: hypothetical protein PWQ22_580 [Archaeoglobaceae archaeon]|nr:hypothetical protein [Archaeoglobaceae archaeon]